MNTDRRLNWLKERLTDLQEELGKALSGPDMDYEEIVGKIKALEEEKRQLNKQKLIDKANKRHKEMRNFLKDVLAVNFPKHEDIQNNDGSFHATKVKKYPKIVALMEKYPYTRFTTDNGVYIKAESGRETYTLREPFYSSGKPTVYKDFKTFEDALAYNSIKEKDLTLKQFLKLESKIQKESERIKKEVEKSYQKLKSLDVYYLENENLISQNRNNSFYTFR